MIPELARFGVWGDTGVRRAVALSERVIATDRYARWCGEGGLAVPAPRSATRGTV